MQGGFILVYKLRLQSMISEESRQILKQLAGSSYSNEPSEQSPTDTHTGQLSLGNTSIRVLFPHDSRLGLVNTQAFLFSCHVTLGCGELVFKMNRHRLCPLPHSTVMSLTEEKIETTFCFHI